MKNMILFTILLIALAVLAVLLLVFTGVIGGATLLVFGDIIVFALIVMLIVKLFRKEK
jgi:hypothetical protein